MIEKVLNKRNLQRAYAQVVQNGDIAGVDGVSVRDLREQLREHWPAIALDVVHMRYLPQPIKGVEIPKSNGKTRLLGYKFVSRYERGSKGQYLLTVKEKSWGKIIQSQVS